MQNQGFFTISQRFLGNLGVDQIIPPKLCATLLSIAGVSFHGGGRLVLRGDAPQGREEAHGLPLEDFGGLGEVQTRLAHRLYGGDFRDVVLKQVFDSRLQRHR